LKEQSLISTFQKRKKIAHHSARQQNICGLKKNSTVTSFFVSSRTSVRDLIRYWHFIRFLPSAEITCRSQ